MENYCIEFPAGLIDKGESVATCALRELQEETGYTGKIKRMSKVVSGDPGMSQEMLQYAFVDVTIFGLLFNFRWNVKVQKHHHSL